MALRGLFPALLLLFGCPGPPGPPGLPQESAPPGDSAEPCVPDVSLEPGLAVVERGAYRGVLEGVWAWKGVPYAAAPSGELRWRAPQPPPCDPVPRLADTWAPRCPQQPLQDGQPVYEGDEDCLALDVWAPAEALDDPRPVLVFLHGGGNLQGSADHERAGVVLYDGAPLAEAAGLVVVTAQYRLGLLGFLALEALAAEDPGAGAGNYGLLDQRAALDWVQHNIAAFGGDPDRVMLVGQSAGAWDACALLASSAGEGWFHAAVLQSGGCAARSLAAREPWFEELLAPTGCAGEDRLACLRALPASALVALQPTVPVDDLALLQQDIGPTIDGVLLMDSPEAALARGEGRGLPVVLGSNRDEAVGWVGALEAEAYPGAVAALLAEGWGGADAEPVLALYPLEDFGSPREAYARVAADAQLGCPARRVARALAGSGGPVWRYHFEHGFEDPPSGGWASHGLELFFLFQALDRLPEHEPTAEDRAVQDLMLDAWSRVARGEEPAGGRLAAWPSWDVATDPYLALGPAPGVAYGLSSQRCDLWDSLEVLRP